MKLHGDLLRSEQIWTSVPDMHQVNSKLRNARFRLGLTVTQVAERCTAAGAKVHNGQISRYERGLTTPEPRIRAILADILGVDAATDFGPGALIDEEAADGEAAV